MLTGLLFSRAFCQPSRVTAGTMGPIEGANWTVRTCICSHWLFGPLECYWPLCGLMAAHGVSLGVVFATSLPTHPSPSHPAPPPIPPTPLLSILMVERDSKKYLEIQPSETEKVSYNRKQ